MIRKRLLPWLLHLANQQPTCREDFYALKDHLLTKHGTFQRVEIQRIAHPCWSCNYGSGCTNPNCYRCSGTGFYTERFYALRRYIYGKYIFHIPTESLSYRPTSWDIDGKIKHEWLGYASNEAELWLYLMFGKWKAFWNAARRIGRIAAHSQFRDLWKFPLVWYAGRYVRRQVAKRERIEQKANKPPDDIPF